MKVTLTRNGHSVTEEFKTPQEAIRFIDAVSAMVDLLVGSSARQRRSALKSAAQPRVQSDASPQSPLKNES